MIVRNEAHIVVEALDSVAPYISSWVIVDTGSDDGTQDLIRDHMARLGIPGELHERPWRNFGDNRTEALTLAQGHGDYVWVVDADDLLVGTPDFAGLDADVYWVRYVCNSHGYYRSQLFRDGVRVRWVGVTHEAPMWDFNSCVEARLGATTTSRIVNAVRATCRDRSMSVTVIYCWPRWNAIPGCAVGLLSGPELLRPW
ncbi:glycosyl transferase 2 family protein [Mycobacterium kansasii]|uniref:Glycosyl transferase 2 family protein n=1 Tax=Mycobacterium kansasii TaxID=1768 RepID=A0A1V3WI99_MYCKA|nr:glycosyl transferase 2 family protein [Mycobacterium kansasii]